MVLQYGEKGPYVPVKHLTTQGPILQNPSKEVWDHVKGPYSYPKILWGFRTLNPKPP